MNGLNFDHGRKNEKCLIRGIEFLIVPTTGHICPSPMTFMFTLTCSKEGSQVGIDS